MDLNSIHSDRNEGIDLSQKGALPSIKHGKLHPQKLLSIKRMLITEPITVKDFFFHLTCERTPSLPLLENV